jgi:hypothetical protein
MQLKQMLVIRVLFMKLILALMPRRRRRTDDCP